MSDRYARLLYGFNDDLSCSDYLMGQRPQACLAGSASAQNAVAMEQLVSNGLTFFTSSLIGSLSDEYGRKGMSRRCHRSTSPALTPNEKESSSLAFYSRACRL